tara:strand:+ start:237 stop:1508 length:1272 start_codon:yes stop_codon:yes gene_type:complete
LQVGYTKNNNFYEIEPGIVQKVFMHPTDPFTGKVDPDWPVVYFTKEDGTQDTKPNLEFIGAVRVRLLHSHNAGTFLNKLVRPISLHMTQYPVVGELVNVANYGDKYYYSNPLNIYNRVFSNRLDNYVGDGKVIDEKMLYNRPIFADSGDTVFQGRFGQSMHFGSDEEYISPFVKITAGQNSNPNDDTEYDIGNKNQDISFPHIEDLNNDDASILLTTRGHVDLINAAPSLNKPKIFGPHSSIVTNAGSIAINAKHGDIFHFAKNTINLAANQSISLEAPKGNIYLGAASDYADNPAVKGKELKALLNEIVVSVKAFATNINDVPEGEGGVPESVKTSAEKLAKDMAILQGQLEEERPKFLSKRVFMVSDLNPDNEEDKELEEFYKAYMDAEFKWEDVEWPEIKEVKDEYYEVEKITNVAGVRG